MIGLNNLLVNNLDTTNLLEQVSIEESYFISTLDFITEMKNEVRENSKVLYLSIMESGNDYEVINESFSDFFGKFKTIIDKFLAYIKSLFQRFITAMNKLVRSDKYLIKHEKDIRSFSDKFDIDGYEYTFNPNVPIINAAAAFNEEFIELNFEDIMTPNDNNETMQSDVKDRVVKLYSQLSSKLEGEYYDEFRSKVIGRDGGSIPQYDFVVELSKIFRDGYDSKHSITIDQDFALQAFNRFKEYKTTEAEVKKIKSRIDSEYKEIERKVGTVIKRNRDLDMNKLLGQDLNPAYDGNGSLSNITVSNDVWTKLNLYIELKVKQVTEMSTIHAMAFSYKLDALKECYVQDKKVLYKILSEVQKTHKGGN